MGVSSDIANLFSAADAVVVAPSDTTVLSGVRALWVGGAGNLTLTFRSGDVVLQGVAAGQLLPISPSKVKAASTATLIIALL